MKKEVNEKEEEEEEEESVPGSTLFVKNLNFGTTEEKLLEVRQFMIHPSGILQCLRRVKS